MQLTGSKPTKHEAHNLNDTFFHKEGNATEQEVYQLLGNNCRIVPFLGIDEYGNTVLRRLNKGDLWNYLVEHTDIPLRTRMIWAIEIAQGLAHLHSKKVVWADAHFRNILMTDDLHVVLCDFAFSVINPDRLWWYSTSPPMVFASPMGYYGLPSTYLDIFGFGVMLFALLSNRFPHCKNWYPRAEEQDASHLKHCDGIYDKLPDPLDRYFGRIVADCFNVRFPSASELVKSLECAYRCWIADQPKAYDPPKVPYPQDTELTATE